MSQRENCTGGYTAGTVVQLSAVPNTGYAVRRLERGCGWHEQPGLGDDGREQECDSEHARRDAAVAPSGTLTSWDNTFSWTGLSEPPVTCWKCRRQRWHPGAPQVVHQRADGLSGGTACSVIPPELAEPGERGLQVAHAGLWCLWLWNLDTLYDLHVEPIGKKQVLIQSCKQRS